MKSKSNRLEKDLVGAAFDFYGHRPWQGIDSSNLFLIRVPDDPLPLVASVMGSGGEEFGLILARGESAMSQFVTLVLEGPEAQNLGELGDLLSVSFDAWSNVADEYRRLIQRVGKAPRRESRVPIFFNSPPHQEPHPTGRADMRMLLAILRGLNAALVDGVLRPKPLDVRNKRILEVEIQPAGKQASYVVREVDWPELVIEMPALLMLPGDLKNFPRLHERWLLARIALPGRIGDDDRLPFVLLLATENGPIHGTRIIMGADHSGGAELVTEIIRGKAEHGKRAGRPTEIVFNNTLLHAALAPALAGLDIKTKVDPESEAFDDLLNIFNKIPLEPEFELRSDSLESWKTAELETAHLISHEIMEKELFTPRAHKRYFGAAGVGQEVLGSLEHLSPHIAFTEWLAADYRVTVRSKTLIEKLLAKKNLPWEIQTLLEARQDPLTSVYCILSREPGLSLEVEDIFDGERYTIIDKALSGCELDGCFLPLRLMSVKDWIFPLIAGPPMTAVQVRSLLTSVVMPGTEWDRTLIEDEPEILGYLWSALLHWRPPHMTNTDGDELEQHSASFRVLDMQKLIAFLNQHPEFDYDEEDTAWDWFRENGPAGIGQRTLLGRLSFIDETLLLDVNSVERFERVRSWLDASGYAVFDSVTTSDFDPDQRPLDDRLPSEDKPPSSEMTAALQAMMLEYYKKWVDEPVPMLGNLTPRRACKSAKGRRTVQQMVRTMPAIQTPNGPIPIPRNEILKELGILGKR